MAALRQRANHALPVAVALQPHLEGYLLCVKEGILVLNTPAAFAAFTFRFQQLAQVGACRDLSPLSSLHLSMSAVRVELFELCLNRLPRLRLDEASVGLAHVRVA